MPIRSPRAAAYVAIGGAPLDVPFFNSRCTAGFDQNIATASFEVPYVTRRIAVGTWINLFIGASPAIPTSFVGRVTGYDWRNWPKSVVVELKGPLSLAEEYFPPTKVDLAGYTDIGAIRLILTACGIPTNQQLILGSGATLGLTVAGAKDERFIWQTTQSGLDMIQALDEASVGFRTFDSGGSGLVIRRQISSIPLADASYTFTGGVDIGEGSSTHMETHRGTVGTVVFGYTGQTGIQILATSTAPARAGGAGYDVIDNPLIETQTQADDIAAWGAGELGRAILAVSLVTPRDDAVRPGQTIDVDDIDRLVVQKKFWAQNVTRQLQTDGAFSQTITLISEAVVDTTTGNPGTAHLPGTGTQESPPGSSAGADIHKPTADFAFEAVDHEVTDGASEFWIVQVRDASWSPSGSISARAWSTDTVTVPDTGTEQEFLFKTTSLATVVTLTVTDSNGETATVTKPCDGVEPDGVTLNRHLYLAGSSAAIAYDGAGSWNVQTLATEVVANGPAWATGSNVDISTDDLATAPGAAVAFASQATSAVFCETDVNVSNVYAGGDGGSVSLSTDGGSTWTEKLGPSLQPVRRIIASRFTPGELWVLDDAGDIYQSPNYGASWSLIASRPGAVDMCLSNFRNWVAGSFGVKTLETGLSATWPGSTPNIVAIDTHIRADVVYALADDGSTFSISPEGGLAMVAGASLPAGTAQVRGIRRDGAAVDLVYVASGTNGLYKSHDGLRTTAAYTLIYAGGEDIVSVGYGDFALAFTPPTPPFVAVLFVVGSVYAMSAAGHWETRNTTDLPTPGPNYVVGFATDKDNIEILDPFLFTRYISTDGGFTFSSAAGTPTFPGFGATVAIRGGVYYGSTNFTISGDVLGIYTSSDGHTWTLFWKTSPIPDPPFADSQYNIVTWAATSTGAVYLIMPDVGGGANKLWRNSFATTITVGVTIDNKSRLYSSVTGDHVILALNVHVFFPLFSDVTTHLYTITGTTITEHTPALLDGTTRGYDFFSPDGTTWVAILDHAGGTRDLIRSGDGGVTWTTVLVGGFINSHCFDPGVANQWWALMFSGGVNHLYKSTDNGATWAEEMVDEPPFNSVLPFGGVCR